MDTTQNNTYPAQPRLVRASSLNTIVEEGMRSDSEGEQSDVTIKANPRHANIDAVLAFVRAQAATHEPPDVYRPASPTQSITDSDIGTVFSEESCPSLDSEPTTFRTCSSRSSVVSGRSARNRCQDLPALYIPRTSWASAEIPIRAVGLDMDIPSGKSHQAPPNHYLSPQNIANLSQSYDEQTSYDDDDSRFSIPIHYPPTPEVNQYNVPPVSVYEIRLDDSNVVRSPVGVSEHNTDIHDLSPQEWSDVVLNFPAVPSTNPQATIPLASTCEEASIYDSLALEDGVHLPTAAWQTLARMTGPQSPHSSTNSTESTIQPQMEMRQCPDEVPKRPPNAAQASPTASDCFTPISIPSPSDFFTSIKNTSDDWWIREQAQIQSADAEKFYDLPWSRDESVEQHFVKEDDDMYGSGDEIPKLVAKKGGRHEYEEMYEQEIRQAAGANFDRTSFWLSQQSSYLSALLDEPGMLDLDDYLPVPVDEPCEDVAVAAKSLSSAPAASELGTIVQCSEKTSGRQRKSQNSARTQEPIFGEAFEHLAAAATSADPHLYAGSRIQALKSERLAMPEKYVDCLLGMHNLQRPDRPKYSGPFGQNPAQSGGLSNESEVFKAAERQQAAIASIQASNWQIEALRSLFNGRLFASSGAHRHLTRAMKKSSKKTVRVLDLGGNACASWGWHVAYDFSSAKVFTAVARDHSTGQQAADAAQLSGPTNHRMVSVPSLWRLPFPDNHFDVISVRNLHALLKNNPVPDAPKINEWDMTLRECRRVLKTGGFLDFMVMDNTIANAGPKSEIISAEFGFDLLKRGYEKEAAKAFLPRLKSTGFSDVQRTWMFLPMGKNTFIPSPNVSQAFVSAPRPISEVSSISQILRQYMDVEAVQGPVGSTQAVADLTGLIGARMWEEWIVKIRSENGRSKASLLDGVDAVLEEGKEIGSGWKVLIGWARKPRPIPNPQLSIPSTICLTAQGCCEITPVESPGEAGTLPFMLDQTSLTAQVAEYRAQYEQSIPIMC